MCILLDAYVIKAICILDAYIMEERCVFSLIVHVRHGGKTD